LGGELEEELFTNVEFLHEEEEAVELVSSSDEGHDQDEPRRSGLHVSTLGSQGNPLTTPDFVPLTGLHPQ